MNLKPCYLSQILIDEQADQQVLFVTECEGQRRFAISIGPLEAMAIDRVVKGQTFPRPLTHDLIVTLLAAARCRCQEIRIVELKEGTFYAQLLLAGHDGKDLTIDCRPSDALALMVRLPGVPLLVDEGVLAGAAEG
jgi:bifunctional DNase/RNase